MQKSLIYFQYSLNHKQHSLDPFSHGRQGASNALPGIFQKDEAWLLYREMDELAAAFSPHVPHTNTHTHKVKKGYFSEMASLCYRKPLPAKKPQI